MDWINIKDKLPDDGETVVIKLNYVQPYVCIARFFQEFSTASFDGRDVFIMMQHPKFPKPWLFTEEYKKLYIIPKKKVELWFYLPDVRQNV